MTEPRVYEIEAGSGSATLQPSRPSCSSLVERCDGRFGYVFVRSNSHAAKQRTWT